MTTPMINPTTSLEDVLAYHHKGVIRRYCKEQNASPEAGEECFREMLKWLYLCYRYLTDEKAHSFVCAMTPEILLIDEMWHCFVLHTRDYAEFCEKYFGFFLHHEPADDAEEKLENPPDLAAMLTEQLGFVHDILGEATLRAWYEECRYAKAE